MIRALVIFLFLAGMLLGHPPISADEPLFVARRAFPTGDGPSVGPVAVTTGRFRGPTFPLDLAVVNAFSDDVAILFGDGHGNFTRASNLPGLNYPFHIIAEDFSNRGILDLAIANLSSNTVAVLRGNGDGTFQPPQNYRVASFPATLAAADFNGDRYLDLAAAVIGPVRLPQCTGGRNLVAVLLNNGDGTFRQAHHYEVEVAPEGIGVGDFDEDGNIDIATANLCAYNMSVLFGDGAGNFPSPRTNLDVGRNPSSVVVADFNNDGHLDLATINEMSNTISILLGDGAGGFRSPRDCVVLGGLRIVGADFNNDGNMDLAVAGGDYSKMFILLGDGSGGFISDCRIAGGDTPPAFNSGPFTVNLAVGDFNGDGVLDIVAANKGTLNPPGVGNISVLTGDGYGNFGIFHALENAPIHVAVDDLNTDGNSDLVVANIEDNTVSVLLGDGFGGFSAPETYAVERRPVSIAIADFNNDGTLDLAVANFGSDSVSVLLGNGDGSFQPAQSSDIQASLPNSLVVADFDCDGNEDLAIANPGSNNVRILYGDGTGGFARSRTLSTDDMIEPLSVVKADFNGDNRWDVGVVNRSSNNVSIFLADGCSPSSGFIEGSSVALTSDAQPTFLQVGDFNNDGKPDLVIANTNLNTIFLFWGNGDGTFREPSSLSVGLSPISLAIADYDGDDQMDLAVANLGSNSVSVFLGRGDGSFTHADGSPFFVGLGPTALSTGHFQNTTGLSDLVITDWNSRVISILLNNRHE